LRRISEELTRKEMKVPPFVGGIDPQLERGIGICARCKACSCRSAISKQRTCTSRRWTIGADAAERWFTEKEVEEVVEFVNKMAV
jgi:hypothetical protein